LYFWFRVCDTVPYAPVFFEKRCIEFCLATKDHFCLTLPVKYTASLTYWTHVTCCGKKPENAAVLLLPSLTHSLLSQWWFQCLRSCSVQLVLHDSSVVTGSRETSDDFCEGTQRCGEWVPVLGVTHWLNVINPELGKHRSYFYVLLTVCNYVSQYRNQLNTLSLSLTLYCVVILCLLKMDA
jgi:hypothetical protein